MWVSAVAYGSVINQMQTKTIPLYFSSVCQFAICLEGIHELFSIGATKLSALYHSQTCARDYTQLAYCKNHRNGMLENIANHQAPFVIIRSS